jgi:hypothetical protein
MLATVELLKRSQWSDVSGGLRSYAVLPDWLIAATQPERVMSALISQVPELAAGALTLRACKIKHMGLDDSTGRWTGEYHFTVEGPQPGQKQTVLLHGTLFPPDAVEPAGPAERDTSYPFGADGWRCCRSRRSRSCQRCPT